MSDSPEPSAFPVFLKTSDGSVVEGSFEYPARDLPRTDDIVDVTDAVDRRIVRARVTNIIPFDSVPIRAVVLLQTDDSATLGPDRSPEIEPLEDVGG
jgi:hypothetical protein